MVRTYLQYPALVSTFHIEGAVLALVAGAGWLENLYWIGLLSNLDIFHITIWTKKVR